MQTSQSGAFNIEQRAQLNHEILKLERQIQELQDKITLLQSRELVLNGR